MDKINITSELLERYHRGHCNAAEVLAVENWMDGGEEELFENSINPDAKKQLEEELWGRIVLDICQKPSRQLRLSSIYRVAASILLVMVLGYIGLHYSRTKLEKVPTTIVQHRMNSLLFTALSDNPVSFSLDKSKGLGEVEFSNAMLIHNEGAEDVHLQVRVTGSTGLQDFVCRKGISYVAVRLNLQERQSTGKEMLFLEKDQLWTIPPLDVISDFYKKLNELERIHKS